MAKELKKWNGRGHGKYNKYHINVAAYSQKQAAELVGQVCTMHIPISEIREYYSPCWGNSMDNITASIPGVWVELRHSGNPTRII